MEEVSKFWDNIHKNRLIEYLGDGDFTVATRGFNRTPDFLDNYKNSQAYLDIGPGFGHAILQSDAKVKGVADISLAAIQNIQGKDSNIEGFLISDLPPNDKYDLITCISVVQHCNKEALKNVIGFAYEALAPNGTLYIEGVCLNDGSDRGHDDVNTHSGSHMWNSEDILKMWDGKCTYNQFDLLNEEVGVWWLGLEKAQQ